MCVHTYLGIMVNMYTDSLLLPQARWNCFISGCTRTRRRCVSTHRQCSMLSLPPQQQLKLYMHLIMQQQFLTLDDIKESNNIDMVEYAGKVGKFQNIL